MQAADQLEIFARRENVVKCGGLGDVSDSSLHLEWLLDDIEAGDASRAACRADHPSENLDRGGLACTVGTKEAEDLTWLYAQVQARERELWAVLARQVVGLDHGDKVISM